MDSIGKRLKEARLEKGLSLEELHKRTKISPALLKAIEEDRIIDVSPVYMKGFIKIYCKTLGLNPKEYIADYKEPYIPVIHPIESDSETGFSGADGKAFIAGFINFIMGLPWKKIIIGLLVIAALVGLVNLVKGCKGPQQEVLLPALARTGEKKTAAKLETKGAVGAESPVHKAVTAAPAVVVKTSVPAFLRLGIHVKETCYINLKADGKTLLQGSLRKGASEEWKAKEKFELSVGNAGVVELEINGRLIANLGRKNQAIKGIIITKEGLSIPQ